MKSVKPGRGPSMMGGIVGIMLAVFGVVFLIVLINSSNSFDSYGYGGFGSGPVTLGIVFCIIFIITAAIVAVYNFVNAGRKNRYSVLDITDGQEEPDPLNEKFGSGHYETQPVLRTDNAFCPYCGSSVQGDFEFCNACGKKLPK
jgi:hypothetical protein